MEIVLATNNPHKLHEVQKICEGLDVTFVLPPEEFNPEELKVGKFFNLASEQYIRIPTGAFIINKESREQNTKDNNDEFYKIYDESEYPKEYLKRDRNSIFVYNRPNLEKFERELGEHFNVDLNEQSNNINVDYIIKDKTNGSKEILYTCDVTKTRYNVNNEEIEDTHTYVSKVISGNNQPQRQFNIFDLVTQSLDNGAISSFVTKDGLYSLEEMIPLNDKFFIKNFENGTENIVEKNCKI